MTKKEMPTGISVIYFNDETKNIYAELPLDKWYAQRLARRLYRNAMTAIATERKKRAILLQTPAETAAIPLDNNIQIG